MPSTDPVEAREWRSLRAKRRGSDGWCVRSNRRRPYYLITASPVGSFWRIGLCDRVSDAGWPVESCHVRVPDEREALTSVAYLAAVAEQADAD